MKFKIVMMCSVLSFTSFEMMPFPSFADGSYSAPGQITNGGGGQVGSIDRSGNLYNGGGGQIGNIASNGTVYNAGGGVIGNIGGDGTIYNGGGGIVGKIASDGTVTNGGGGQIGKIGSDGTVYNGGGGIVGHVPAGTGSALTNNGTSSFAQVEAEIQQRGMPQPVPQGQPSCYGGCMPSPSPDPSQTAVIRAMDGFLVGWKTPNGNLEIKVNYLPELHLLPSILKYSGMDSSLSLDEGGIWRIVLSSELEKIAKKNPEIGMDISDRSNHDIIQMGKVDASGQITDLHGRKIAYEELGDIVYDSQEHEKDALDQLGEEFGYPNVLGVFEPNGDIRDVHNRLVGHLEEFQRDDPRQDTGQPAALKLIQKYERRHPWHTAGHKVTKGRLK